MHNKTRWNFAGLAGLALVLAAASCGPESAEDLEDLEALDGAEMSRTSQSLSTAVTQWRKLVEKHFKYQHVTWALNIIKCESGGNPNAYNSSSGASGLFQHLKKYWPARAAAAGFAGHSPFHAEANIAASAYLLYAPGGGPQHWSCKFSPFENFNYTPQFYKNGKPVGCTPSCNGSKIIGKDCGVGNCATYGATCVNDALGVRCVSVFCPAQGKKKVCVNTKLIGDCNNGGISTGDCSIYGAFCSTAGNTTARCVSAFCASGPGEVTKAHGICLPDGRQAQCTAEGGLANAAACPAGQTCVATTSGASCVAPSADSGVEPADSGAAADAGVPLPEADLGLPPLLDTDGGGASHGDAQTPASAAAAGSGTLYGSCQVGAGLGVPDSAPPWLLLLLPVVLALRVATRRRGHRRRGRRHRGHRRRPGL